MRRIRRRSWACCGWTGNPERFVQGGSPVAGRRCRLRNVSLITMRKSSSSQKKNRHCEGLQSFRPATSGSPPLGTQTPQPCRKLPCPLSGTHIQHHPPLEIVHRRRDCVPRTNSRSNNIRNINSLRKTTTTPQQKCPPTPPSQQQPTTAKPASQNSNP